MGWDVSEMGMRVGWERDWDGMEGGMGVKVGLVMKAGALVKVLVGV